MGALDEERDALMPDNGRGLPRDVVPLLPFTLAVIAAGSATRPNASFVMSLSRSFNFRARISCFSASSSLRASSSLSSSSSLVSSPPFTPSDDDPARDDAGESGRSCGERGRFGPCSVIVDDEDTFFAGRGYRVPTGFAESGL